ncbi:MAG TPA: hypothetical protein PLN21_10995 [Gemmatales bacterium]|nr:hypothetical protein [Gemmatales bacterium]
MLRSLLGLALALGLALPLFAGEMDNDSSAKKAQPNAALSTDTVSLTTAVSELDKESPTQSWRRCGWGGWGCCSRGWGCGWGGGWSCGWRGGWGGGWGWGGGCCQPWGGVVRVGFVQPWGGVSFVSGW